MCCFSGPVTSVTNTRIFARGEPDGRQNLVYRMDLTTDAAVAMVLPIPVPPQTAESAVTFIDLSGYASFFTDLAMAWTPPKAQWTLFGSARAAAAAPAPAPLEVHSVGSFETSFVPTIADFARLDLRFRLPDNTWATLPQYRTYGFVVFKLKAGKQAVQPMAFRFPRADAKSLFFPTVHIHDGIVHTQADFDHELYLQDIPDERLDLGGFVESDQIGKQVMQLDKCQGLVAGDAHFRRLKLTGARDNTDIVVAQRQSHFLRW